MSHPIDPREPVPEDAQLSAALSAMKRDRAPDDIEARLLTALAAGTVAGSAATAATLAKASPASKALLLLKASWWAKLGVVLVSAGTVWTAQRLLTPSATPSASLSSSSLASVPRAPEASAPALASAAGDPATPTLDPLPDPAALLPPATTSSTVPSDHALPRSGRAQLSALPPRTSPSEPPASAAAIVASAPLATASAPSTPPDALSEELAQVRAITALVQAGQCDLARPQIAAYRRRSGQKRFASEVEVLAVRCQRR